MLDHDADRAGTNTEGTPSIADLFQAASQELARSDARIYRSVDRHLTRMREILKREECEMEEARLLDEPSTTSLQGPPSYELWTPDKEVLGATLQGAWNSWILKDDQRRHDSAPQNGGCRSTSDPDRGVDQGRTHLSASGAPFTQAT